MADKCAKCGNSFVESDLVVGCTDCRLNFHGACTRAGSTRSFVKSGNKTLKCDSCIEESKSNASTRSTEGSEDKKVILEAIQSLKLDICKIDEKMNTVLLSISALQEESKKLKEVAIKLEGEQQKLQERCNKLERSNEVLTGEVKDLQLRLQDAEQHSRSANVEIVGLPVTPKENILDCMAHVAGALGIPFKAEDISTAHRLHNFSSKRHSHPPIIVQFVSRTCREAWLRAARARKNLNAVDIHPSLQRGDVYINEHLTPHNKALLGKARRLRREKKLFFAGCFNGKVFVKASEGAVGVRVATLDDLDVYEGKKRPCPDSGLSK